MFHFFLFAVLRRVCGGDGGRGGGPPSFRVSGGFVVCWLVILHCLYWQCALSWEMSGTAPRQAEHLIEARAVR